MQQEVAMNCNKGQKKTIFILRINDQTLFRKNNIIFPVFQMTEKTPQHYLVKKIRKLMER